MKKLLALLLLPATLLAQTPPMPPASPADVAAGTATYKGVTPYSLLNSGIITATNLTAVSNLALRIATTNLNAFATNSTTSTNLAGSVHIIRSGVWTRYPNVMVACSNQAPGDTIFLTGTNFITVPVRIMSSVTMVNNGTIMNAVEWLGTNGPAIALTGTNATFMGGVIMPIHYNLGTNSNVGFEDQAAIGVSESGLGNSRSGFGGATNFMVRDVTMYGMTDVAYFRATNGANAYGMFKNCELTTRFDALLLAEGSHRLNFQGCKITAIGPNFAAGDTERSMALSAQSATGSLVIWDNCTFTISNNLALFYDGSIAGGVTNLYRNCAFTNLNPAADTDFYSDGGDGDVLIFENCTGIRPTHVQDDFVGGGGIIFRQATSGGMVFGGNAFIGNRASIGVGASETVLPFTGTLTGNGGGLTNTGGYVLPFLIVIGSSPADATTYYIGGDVAASANAWTTSGTSYTDSSAVIPKSGTVKRIWMKVRVRTTPGSGETVSTYFRLNNTSDSGQIDTVWNGTTIEGSNAAVGTAVTAGDTYAIKVVTPTWVTNPTGVTVFGFIYIE